MRCVRTLVLRKGSVAGVSLLLTGLILIGMGCNRAAVRIPGLSESFPETLSGYQSKQTYPMGITVALPVDLREKHYGEAIAGTKWKACDTDAGLGAWSTNVIRQRLVAELQAAKMFDRVEINEAKPNNLVLQVEVHAFCSRVVGFLFVRAGGMTALNFKLLYNNQIVYSKRIEHVVTDADPEYSGSQVTSIEQGMKRTMADSLRIVISRLLADLETEVGKIKPERAMGPTFQIFSRNINKQG